MPREKRPAGFTLVEMLVVLAVLGVLFALYSWVPWRPVAVSRAAYDLRDALIEAKQEAIRRNRSVWVAHSDTAAWICLSNDAVCRDHAEGALRRVDLTAYRGELSLSSTLPGRCLRWRPEGFPSRCDDVQPLSAKIALHARGQAVAELCISPGGSIRLAKPGGCE